MPTANARATIGGMVKTPAGKKPAPRKSSRSKNLATAEAGLRLRYEITRRFAPYVGLVHERAFGDTADYRRDESGRARDTRVVAGLRLWF